MHIRLSLSRNGDMELTICVEESLEKMQKKRDTVMIKQMRLCQIDYTVGNVAEN